VANRISGRRTFTEPKRNFRNCWAVVFSALIQFYCSLARLQLARTYVALGDTTKARTSYQDFLALWKDADLEIPVFKQAKAECAKLQ
jgi:hypothetical protein